jgi:hypothetical protein
MENHKILNATPTVELGVAFKSKIEASIYKELIRQGLNPNYEEHKFSIWEGFKPSAPFYEKSKKTKTLTLNNKKIKDITYTPDFSFKWGKYTIYVEVKPDSFTNDVYPYKQKLFRKYMETNLSNENPIFVRIGTIKAIREFINILKTEYNEES